MKHTLFSGARWAVWLLVGAGAASALGQPATKAKTKTKAKAKVKTAKVKATNYKACLALEVPAYVAFYKSPPEFLGDDVLTIEVKYAGGRTEIQKITVNVVGVGAQQKI